MPCGLISVTDGRSRLNPGCFITLGRAGYTGSIVTPPFLGMLVVRFNHFVVDLTCLPCSIVSQKVSPLSHVFPFGYFWFNIPKLRQGE